VMEEYNWVSAEEKVWGTVVMSNVQTSITNPSAAFAVPAACNGVQPIDVTSQELKNAFSYALAYSGT